MSATSTDSATDSATASATDSAMTLCTLRLPAELTIYTAAETRAAWLAWCAAEAGQIEAICRVDAAAVDEVDAAGAQLLVALANSLGQQQSALQLCNASRPLRQACEDLGLAGLLAPANDEGSTATPTGPEASA